MKNNLTSIINNNEDNKFGIIKNYENKINNLLYQIDCLKQENFNIKQQFHINENNHLENTNLIYEESQKINKEKERYKNMFIDVINKLNQMPKKEENNEYKELLESLQYQKNKNLELLEEIKKINE